MLNYLIKRICLAVITLFGITLITFFTISLAAGDPAQLQSRQATDRQISGEAYNQLRVYYQLDKPLFIRYIRWLGRLARGDFGSSLSADRRQVSEKIKERIWPTASVMILSLFISLCVSIPVGIYAAVKRNSLFDTISSAILYVFYSMPGYVMATALILLVCVRWNLLPFQGTTSDNYQQLTTGAKLLDSIKHYALITFCYGSAMTAYYCRFIRHNMLEVLGQDYIRAAHARGLGPFSVVVRHGFANILPAVLTLFGHLLPSLIGGSVILEVIFNWPGMGRLFYESMMCRDYPVIMAVTFISACLVLAGTLLADISYPLVDPRVIYE